MLNFFRSHKLSLFILLFLFLFLPSIYHLSSLFLNASALAPRYTVLIDAGHGGFDPGKVGIDGSLEKDINLSIALKLKQLLLHNDVEVIMTRESDTALSTDSDTNKKRADMKNRRDQLTTYQPDLAVSIHQNSFPSEKQKGAQVFYYVRSKESEELAKFLQEQLVATLDPTNHRTQKSNDSYYLLKGNSCPMVIIECGFLSNYEEASKLNSEEYQNQIAWAIHLGIMRYLNTYS